MRRLPKLLVLIGLASPLMVGCASRSAAEAPKAQAKPAPAVRIAEGNAVSQSLRALTRAGARVAIEAIVSEAQRRSVGAAISVVDEGGHLVAAERIDGTFSAGSHVSEGKAKTAVAFKRPTAFFEKIIREGRTPMVALDEGFTPLQGGVPIEAQGQILGAVGVSGASSAAEDEELATVGVNAVLTALGAPPIATTPKPVSYFDHNQVRAAFAKGIPLTEMPGYKVHASRRDAPGQVEIHTLDTDIVYVLEGKATLVTGGRAIDAKPTAPNELRGASIEGGETRTLTPGDVMIVPRGVPHWFKSVEGPFTYYVVKAS